MIAEKTPTTLSINHINLKERIIHMERNMHKLEHYSRCECIEIAEILSSIANGLLEEHVTIIFEKLGVVMEPMDIVDRHRLGKNGRVIVKLLNSKGAKSILEEKHKLNSVSLYDDGNTDNNNERKIFINQSLCPYYKKIYGMMKIRIMKL